MVKSIAQYQKSFNAIVDTLNKNSNVLGLMVSGSMVNGDLWEESDIDLTVVCEKPMKEVKNLYAEEEDISVHLKLMTKEDFIKNHENNVRGSSFHRMLSCSRLIFSKDSNVTNIYNNGRYYPDSDRERWSLVYLGTLIKTMGVARKYLYNDRLHTAYSVTVRAVEEFARFYVNCSGYMISHDVLIMATNLNDEFKEIVDLLFSSSFNQVDVIRQALDFIENEIKALLKESTIFLLNFMKENNDLISAEEIRNHKLFKAFNIEMEEILKALYKEGIIKKDSKEFYSDNDELVVCENVYCL